jgi:lysophosphatidiate acyltransferase
MVPRPLAILTYVTLLACVPGIYVVWLILWSFSFIIGQCYYYMLEEYVWSVYQYVCLFFLETLNMDKVIYHGDYDRLKGKLENVLYISNHQSDVDWVICDAITAQQGRIGRLRYVLKEVLKYIPIFGHYFYQHGCIYVDRGNFQVNKAVKSLQFLNSAKLPCWLVIFPEGTRVNPTNTSLMQKSAIFAQQKGLEPLEHHLFPRTKGVELILQNLGDYLDAVYDVTIFYEDCVQREINFERKKAPTLFSWFNKRRTVHVHFKRYDLKDIPKGGDDLLRWLHSIFLAKDKIFRGLIDSMRSSGKEASNPRLPDTPCANLKLPWTYTSSAVVGLILLNVMLFVLPPYGYLGYLLVWLFGTLNGLIVVRLKV